MVIGVVSVCENDRVLKRSTKMKARRDVKRAIVVLPLQDGIWKSGAKLFLFG